MKRFLPLFAILAFCCGQLAAIAADSPNILLIRPYLLTQAFNGAHTLSIRRGPWKYLDHPGSGGNRYEDNPGLKPFLLPGTAPAAPSQLYNLDTDPGETINLSAERTELLKELKALLEQSKSSGRSRPKS